MNQRCFFHRGRSKWSSLYPLMPAFAYEKRQSNWLFIWLGKCSERVGEETENGLLESKTCSPISHPCFLCHSPFWWFPHPVNMLSHPKRRSVWLFPFAGKMIRKGRRRNRGWLTGKYSLLSNKAPWVSFQPFLGHFPSQVNSQTACLSLEPKDAFLFSWLGKWSKRGRAETEGAILKSKIFAPH